MPEMVEDQLVDARELMWRMPMMAPSGALRPHQANGDGLVDPGGDRGGCVLCVGRADPQ